MMADVQENKMQEEKVPLTVGYRAMIEHKLEKYGCFIARNRWVVLFSVLLLEITVIIAWKISGKGIPMESKLTKLWVESGGRLDTEIAYTDEHKQQGFDVGLNLVMFTPKDGNADTLLSEDMLEDHLFVMRKIYEITSTLVKGDNTYTFTMSGAIQEDWEGTRTSYTTGKYSLCDYVPFPEESLPKSGREYYISLIEELVPCNRVTVLDCFQEGEEDFFLAPFLDVLSSDLKESYGLWGYDKLPSFRGKTAAQNLDVAKNGCKGYVQTLMEWDIGMLFGSRITDVNGYMTKAKAFQYMLPFAPPKRLVKKFQVEDITEEEIKKLQSDFAVQLEQLVVDLTQNNMLKAANVYIYAYNTLNRVLEEYSKNNFQPVAVGYGLMLCFILFTHFEKSNEYNNMMLIGLFGLAVVLMGNLFSLSILVLTGFNMNSAAMQVLPFLALGLGVDDLFVFLSVYREVKRVHSNSPAVPIIGAVLKKGGVSVTLTSLCNSAAFSIASIVPLPAVRAFCFASALVVVVNYLTIVIVMPCAFAIRYSWYHNRRMDNIVPENCQNMVADDAQNVLKKKKENSYLTAPASFLTKYYIRMLSFKKVRIVGAVTYVLLSVTGTALSTTMENGLEIIDVVPVESEVYRSMKVITEHFHFSPAQVVTTDVDYGDPAVQQELVAIMDGLNDIERVRNADAAWIKAINMHNGGAEDVWTNASGALFRSKVNEFLDPSKSIYMDAYQSGMQEFGFNDDGDLVYATMDFIIEGASNTDKMVDTLEKTREYLNSKCGPGKVIKWCYPTGSIYTFWEQYINLRIYFFQALILCEVAIFFSCFVLLMNWHIAFWVAFFSLCVVMQIFGALSLIGIKFSAIPAVSLIMSVGIAVEFSAHLCVHFDSAVGNRMDRMNESLYLMFVPIAEGGFSSFLGFIGLAFSPFLFVFLYYFMIYFLVVVVGILNGLFFLPCILSFVGYIPVSRQGQRAQVDNGK